MGVGVVGEEAALHRSDFESNCTNGVCGRKPHGNVQQRAFELNLKKTAAAVGAAAAVGVAGQTYRTIFGINFRPKPFVRHDYAIR
jgi:hypothetical protein